MSLGFMMQANRYPPKLTTHQRIRVSHPIVTFKPLTINYICFMEVNDSLVDKLAHLSRLEFNPAEKEEIKTDLQRMISFVDKLNELDLADTEPLLFMTEEVNVLREDVAEVSIEPGQAFKNAPEHDNRFFTVPKAIKNPNT